MLGMCPTLAVTTSAFNGLGMGLSTMGRAGKNRPRSNQFPEKTDTGQSDGKSKAHAKSVKNSHW